MPVKQYDPKKVPIIFAGQLISGFADGTFLTIKRQTDTFSSMAGADGEVAVVQSADKRGEIVITLLQTSASNDILSAKFAAQELTGIVGEPFLAKDLLGTTIASSDACWIKKYADLEFGKEVSAREWTLECNPLLLLVGGAVV